jgi:glycosyltransferase involved in cell wall biosynthesis
MFHGLRAGVVIPARNEAEALPRVLSAIPEWASPVIVVEHNSTDGTPEVARAHGAIVLHEPRPGYGAACLAGIAALPECDVIVFLDADASDDPSEMHKLVAPIAEGRADFVIGSRNRGGREPGAVTPQQIFGNWLACTLMRLIWGARFTDLGPFRAITADALRKLEMADRNFGWTVEMQIRAVRRGLRCVEVPVTYRQRIGQSKVSGTIQGTVKAGVKILYVIFREAITAR